MSSLQPWLIQYENPLKKRFGRDFFRSIPTNPGVYRMLGLGEAVLYVGKAKNLRARLCSYRSAHPDRDSRKVIRLLHVIEKIEWELCKTEKEALLRENELLRALQPPFNVMNTHPETYHLIGLHCSPTGIRLRLTTEPELGHSWELFGAYKGRTRIRDGFSSLLRLLWACHSSDALAERFEFPGALLRYHFPYEYGFPLDPTVAKTWQACLRRFFRGTSRILLPLMTDRLLAYPNIPPFYYRMIQEDLERLEDFFLVGPCRNRQLRRFHKIEDPFIPQDQLDDLLVTFRPSP